MWSEFVCQIGACEPFCCGVLGVMVTPTGREFVTRVVGLSGLFGVVA